MDEIRVNDLTPPGTPIRSANATPKEPTPQPPEIEQSADLELGSSQDDEVKRQMLPEYQEMTREQRKAKLITVLDRGVVHDRLSVKLPDHLHGEWVRADPLEVDRMRTLGFWVDTEYATKRAIHSDGSAGNRVADVIFVVTTKENKQLIDEVRLEQQLRSARNPKQATEEQVERGTVPSIIPTFSESSQRAVTSEDVKAALNKADGQVKVQR